MLGAVTGVIGAVTGIVGLVLGVVSYRRTNQAKALDMRVSLRKEIADTTALVNELPALVDKAHQSRVAVMAALGTIRTGGFEAWKEQVARDREAARALVPEIPPTTSADTSDHSVLEEHLVAVHVVVRRAERLRDTYLAALEKDDRDREHLRIVRSQGLK